MLQARVAEWRYAFRTVRRSPRVSLVAVLTLALGIGANAALFSLVYGVLVRPLDYQNADRLVAFRVDREFAGRAQRVAANFSLPDLDVWRAQGRSFESVSMTAAWGALLATDAGSEAHGHRYAVVLPNGGWPHAPGTRTRDRGRPDTIGGHQRSTVASSVWW